MWIPGFTQSWKIHGKSGILKNSGRQCLNSCKDSGHGKYDNFIKEKLLKSVKGPDTIDTE